MAGFDLDRKITRFQWQYNLQVNHAVRALYRRTQYDFLMMKTGRWIITIIRKKPATLSLMRTYWNNSSMCRIEKTLWNRFSRKPGRGEAQGCAE